ncbi:hypothetical protein FPV67DRAFT_1664031 [Lyophyllum atratum]|nr:hypothetical protein FPV67DRAFT_1664031 [Lyophyllum atratum]
MAKVYPEFRLSISLLALVTSTVFYAILFFAFFFANNRYFKSERAKLSPVARNVYYIAVFSFLVATLYWATQVAIYAGQAPTLHGPGISRRKPKKGSGGGDGSSVGGSGGSGGGGSGGGGSGGGGGGAGGGHETDFLSIDDLLVLGEIILWPERTLPILSDCCLLLVAWSLYNKNRAEQFFGPILVLLAAAAMNFAYLGITIAPVIATEGTYIAALILPVLANAIFTSMILYKLRTDGKGWNPYKGRIAYPLGIAVESGAAYLVYHILAVALRLVRMWYDSPEYRFSIFVVESFVLTTAMYPTIVLILMVRNQSVTNLPLSVSPQTQVDEDPEASQTDTPSSTKQPTNN